MKVLLVEDDKVLQKTLKKGLETKQYEVICASTYNQAILLLNDSIEFVILDIELPDGNGIQLCKEIKRISNVPIIFLTADNSQDTLIKALNSGGDDYMSKPFSIYELFARMESISRRIYKNEVIHYLDLTIDLDRYLVKKEDVITLTTIEYLLFTAFFKTQSKVLTRYALIEIVEKQTGNFIEDNSLTTYIKRIRKKLGKYNDHDYIETVRGIGYRLYEDK
jgi:DNA-binding response OmpR family regulator